MSLGRVISREKNQYYIYEKEYSLIKKDSLENLFLFHLSSTIQKKDYTLFRWPQSFWTNRLSIKGKMLVCYDKQIFSFLEVFNLRKVILSKGNLYKDLCKEVLQVCFCMILYFQNLLIKHNNMMQNTLEANRFVTKHINL